MSRPFGVALLMAGFDDRGAQVQHCSCFVVWIGDFVCCIPSIFFLGYRPKLPLSLSAVDAYFVP